MAANMADMQKNVADEKLNSHALTQFLFSTISARLHEHLCEMFFKMDANMAAMHKMAACKKANHQILTQFFPSNMLTTL